MSSIIAGLRRFVTHPFAVMAHTTLFHKSRGVAHLVYFAALYLEGHGVYAKVGGLLLVVGVISMFGGDDDDE